MASGEPLPISPSPQKRYDRFRTIDSTYCLHLPPSLNDKTSPPLVGNNYHFPIIPAKIIDFANKTKNTHYFCFTKKRTSCSPCTHRVHSNCQPVSNCQPPEAVELQITSEKLCSPSEHCTSAINPLLQQTPGIYPIFN